MKNFLFLTLSTSIIYECAFANHQGPKTVLEYMQCIHDYECFTEGNKCCQAAKVGGDGVIVLRCGPWLDYSGYTGHINDYMYKCEDKANYLSFATVAVLLSVISTLY